MKVKIQKWGNSLALRIPRAFAVQSRIKENEYVKLILENDKIVVEPETTPEYSLEDLLKGIKKSNLHREFDFGKRAGKEEW